VIGDGNGRVEEERTLTERGVRRRRIKFVIQESRSSAPAEQPTFISEVSRIEERGRNRLYGGTLTRQLAKHVPFGQGKAGDGREAPLADVGVHGKRNFLAESSRADQEGGIFGESEPKAKSSLRGRGSSPNRGSCTLRFGMKKGQYSERGRGIVGRSCNLCATRRRGGRRDAVDGREEGGRG